MLDWYIRKVVKQMILDGEIKFKIKKEKEPLLSPNKRFIKEVDSIKLTVSDKKGNPIAITNTLIEDVDFGREGWEGIIG